MTRKLRFLLLAAAFAGVAVFALIQPPSPLVTDAEQQVVRSLETGPAGLLRFNELALADEDTRLIEGNPALGEAVYATRTRSLMFLADTYYTIATLEDGRLTLSAANGFKRSALEANQERLDFWITYLRDNGPKDSGS